MPRIEVLKIENNLSNRFGDICVIVNYQNRILVEIRLRFGSKPPQYYSHQFLYKLSRSASVDDFKQQVMVQANRLVE